jgi:hypothetical protein
MKRLSQGGDRMIRFDATLLKVFLYGLPGVAILALFTYAYGAGFIDRNTAGAGAANTSAGFVFALWMVSALYLSLRLILSGPFRDQAMARITFIRERDEREAQLTGKAARTTFLMTMALLIFLFCLSCFQVSIYRVPPEKVVDGKTGIVTLGIGFSLLEQGQQDRSAEAGQRQDLFVYRGLPLSGATIILLLILWQVLSYNCTMRRLMK